MPCAAEERGSAGEGAAPRPPPTHHHHHHHHHNNNNHNHNNNAPLPTHPAAQATLAVVERTLPGLPELLLGEALRHEPLAALSRAAAGVRGKCLIVNLPGRPRAVTQNMGALMPLLAHAVRELED